MLRTFKRADLLIEVARRLPHVRFVVCGGPTPFLSPPGYGEQMVSALQAQSNIEYLGKVAPAKSIEIIANASLLLSTSDEEGFPSTFLEAWASGTPVISLKLDPDALIQKHQLGAVPEASKRPFERLRVDGCAGTSGRDRCSISSVHR